MNSVLFYGSTSSTIQDGWARADGATVLFSDSLSNLELRGLDGHQLSRLTPTITTLPDLSLSADPPSLGPYTNVYVTLEDTAPAVGSTSVSPGSLSTSNDEVETLRAAVGQLSLDPEVQRRYPSLAETLFMSEAEIAGLAWPFHSESGPPSGSGPSPSPPPAPSPSYELNDVADSGYDFPRRLARRKDGKKRGARRHLPYPSPSPSPASSPSSNSSSSSPSPSSSPDLPPLRRTRAAPRRNPQVHAPASPSPSSSSSSSAASSPSPKSRLKARFQSCPECGEWFRTSLQRHRTTHKGDQGLWVCRGVPLDDASAWGLDEAAVRTHVEAGRLMLWQGQLMVGGCAQSVSRRDSLLRHMRSQPCEDRWLIGGKPKSEQ